MKMTAAKLLAILLITPVFALPVSAGLFEDSGGFDDSHRGVRLFSGSFFDDRGNDFVLFGGRGLFDNSGPGSFNSGRGFSFGPIFGIRDNGAIFGNGGLFGNGFVLFGDRGLFGNGFLVFGDDRGLFEDNGFFDDSHRGVKIFSGRGFFED